MKGLATVGIFWNRAAARAVLPPRALITNFERGKALGEPGDEAGHRLVLKQAVAMLRRDAPLEEPLD